MKRSNWEKLMSQHSYIMELSGPILDALDEGNLALYEDLVNESNGREQAFMRMVMEVLDDEKDNLRDN